MQFTQANMGRIFILRLQEGERIPEVIETFAEQHDLTTGLCFFLGGAKENSRIVVGPKEAYTFPIDPMTTLLGGVHEGVGIGTLFQNEAGKPKLHMHGTFGRKEEARTGCFRTGVEVWQIGEVVIIELTGAAAKRAKDEKSGFELLKVGSN